jgi:hypothetical protein
MIAFSIQVLQNTFLAPGAERVHAVVSVSATPQAAAGSARPLAEALLLDCSASMGGDKSRFALAAVERTIDLLGPDSWFCLIAGTDSARVVFPLSQATEGNRKAAHAAVRRLTAAGGTAMSTWLDLARRELGKAPAGAIRHALLLTDGKNEGETDQVLSNVLNQCEGRFQCDARGVGADWTPDQLRLISGKLLGTVDIIPSPADIEADFRQVIQQAQGKAVADVNLRLWTPQGAQVESFTQVFPEKVDLTSRSRPLPDNPQLREYPTGSWGAEKRDYQCCIRVTPGRVGQRMCAGRASLVCHLDGSETKSADAMILASWTEDEARSAVIDPVVAHYSGQAELADAIRQGLKAREAGDEPAAVELLGRAVRIAAQTNPETMKLLRKVVEVQDEKQGTVRLLKGVRKEDEFALDTRSTKTARVKKDGQSI